MKKLGIPKFMRMKGVEKIVCITAYDAFSASTVEAADVHLVLVGDSLGHVVQGSASTVDVTLEEMIYHTRIVSKCAPSKLVVADIPFGGYGISVEDTVRNCVQVMKGSGAAAVKMEGVSPVLLEAIPMLTSIGIPVMGHLGFQPQSVNVYGGAKVDGRTEDAGERLLAEARLLEQAGVFGFVLECVVADVAAHVTRNVSVPTIGIGSGPDVDGQIIVFHDLLGMTTGRLPSFVRKYANVAQTSLDALNAWAADINSGGYPSEAETYKAKKD